MWFADCVRSKRDSSNFGAWLGYPDRWPSVSQVEGSLEVCKIRVSLMLVSVELKTSSIHPAGTCMNASENRELGVTGKE